MELEKLNVKNLKILCAQNDIDYGNKVKNEELVDLLQENNVQVNKVSVDHVQVLYALSKLNGGHVTNELDKLVSRLENYLDDVTLRKLKYLIEKSYSIDSFDYYYDVNHKFSEGQKEYLTKSILRDVRKIILPNYYLLGSSIDGVDQTSRWINEGKWELGWFDEEDNTGYKRNLIYFNDMKVGDVVAVKSWSSSEELPNYQFSGDVVATIIKCVGTITDIIDDGHTIKVDWDKEYRERKWYFTPYTRTIHFLDPKDEVKSKVIDFINGAEQDVEYFKEFYDKSNESYTINDVLLEFISFVDYCFDRNDGNFDQQVASSNKFITGKKKNDYKSEICVLDKPIGWNLNKMYAGTKIWEKGLINHDVINICYDVSDLNNRKLVLNKHISRGNNELLLTLPITDENVDIVCNKFMELIMDLNNVEADNIEFTNSHIQRIYAGAPGTGKSYKVENEILQGKKNVIRTTFYPDYEYHNFIGSILPSVSSGVIQYGFVPGPFTTALKMAIDKPEEEVYLIVEEMTRGNCAAIFGDVFQLLDRNDNGMSSYPINNDMIKSYFNDNQVYLDKIFIPSNLSIIGTINTSDQNVFPMDTPFKRRFDFEYLTTQVNDEFKDFTILNGISWKELYTKLNIVIIDITKNDDKQLGPYFLKEGDSLTKLYMYLWDDVLLKGRKDTSKIFNDNIKSLTDIINSDNPLNLK